MSRDVDSHRLEQLAQATGHAADFCEIVQRVVVGEPFDLDAAIGKLIAAMAAVVAGFEQEISGYSDRAQVPWLRALACGPTDWSDNDNAPPIGGAA